MVRHNNENKNNNDSLPKSTMITAEMSTKIDEADYIYYQIDEGILPPPDAYYFVPDEEDVVLQAKTKKWQRLIFPENVEYLEYEEKKYEELDDYIRENNIIIPSFVSKYDLLRFHQANHYKPNKTVEDLLTHLDWRVETLPIILTDLQKKFLDEGLFYLHGRDKNYRPLNIFDPRVIIGKKADRDEVIMIVHFVFQYIINNMFIPGKIENWVSLMDLNKIPLSKLPRKWLVAFIKSCQANYKCRGVQSFVLNASWGMMAIWKMASVFVDSKVKQKIGFFSTSNPRQLVDMFHPSQLEERFGGEAENLSVYWPPKEISKEYGVDPHKIVKPEGAPSVEISQTNLNEEDVKQDNSQLQKAEMLGKSLMFKNKLGTGKVGQVELEDVKISIEDEKESKSVPENEKSIDHLKESQQGKINIKNFIRFSFISS